MRLVVQSRCCIVVTLLLFLIAAQHNPQAAFLVRPKEVIVSSSLHLAGNAHIQGVHASNISPEDVEALLPEEPPTRNEYLREQYASHITLLRTLHADLGTTHRIADTPLWATPGTARCASSEKHLKVICFYGRPYVYSLEKFAWSTGPQAAQVVYAPAVYVLHDPSINDDRFYRFSGSQTPNSNNVVNNIYTVPVADILTTEMMLSGSVGMAGLRGASVAVDNNVAYVYGGADNTGALQNTLYSSTHIGLTNSMSTFGEACMGALMIIHKDYVYIVGGSNGSGVFFSNSGKYGLLSAPYWFDRSYTDLGSDFLSAHRCEFNNPVLVRLNEHRFIAYQIFNHLHDYYCTFEPETNQFNKIAFSNPFGATGNVGTHFGHSLIFVGSQSRAFMLMI